MKKTKFYFAIMSLVCYMAGCVSQPSETVPDREIEIAESNDESEAADHGSVPAGQDDSYVTGEWHVDTPENHGMDGEKLADFIDSIADEPINSMIIVKDGSIIAKYYKGSYDADSIFALNSCTKSITSAVVGIAIDEGFIEGIDVPVSDYFPELEAAADERKKAITFEHILTMTSGFDWPEWTDWNYRFGDWTISDNWVDYVLNREMANTPGEVFNYSTGDTQLVSAIITKATGESERAFAERYLFEPLGITSVRWPEDPQGNSTGGFGIEMSSEDAARFGQLYLNKGKWGEEQIVPEEWVTEATAEHSEGSFYSSKYGYLWWIEPASEDVLYDFYYAMGFGGQYIFVVPELNMVTVFTSSLWNDTGRPYLYFKEDILGMAVVD